MKLNLCFDKHRISAAKIDTMVGTINFHCEGGRIKTKPTYLLAVEGMKKENLMWVAKVAHYFVEMCEKVILVSLDGRIWKKDIVKRIEELRPNGNESLGTALCIADDIIGVVNLLTFTDRVEFENINVGSHVSLHSFCFRRKKHPKVKGGGTSYFVQMLRLIPYDLLDQIMRMCATNVVVHLQARPGCRIVNVYADEIYEHTSTKSYIVRFGNIFAKQRLSIPIKISVDRTIGMGTQFLLDVKVLYKNAEDFKEKWELLTVERV